MSQKKNILRNYTMQNFMNGMDNLSFQSDVHGKVSNLQLQECKFSESNVDSVDALKCLSVQTV